MSSAVPDGWEEEVLGKLGKFSKGKGISKKEIVSSGIPCIRYAEIYTDYNFVIRKLKSFITSDTASNSKRMKQGDIIFAGSGETVEDIGKSVAYVDDKEAYVGGDSIVLSPSKNLDSAFLSYQLNDDLRRITLRKLGQGSSVIHIYSSGLEQLPVQLPPFPEQKKIASILTSVDEVIEKTESQIAKLQDLKAAVMQDLLAKGIGHTEFKDSSVGRIPVGWSAVQLRGICKVQGGYAFKSTDSSESGVRWLKIANVGIGQVKWDDKSYLPKDFEKKYLDYLLDEGDIVIAMTRPVLRNALKVARVKGKDSGSLLNQRVGRIQPLKAVNKEFLYCLFESRIVSESIEKIIFGSDPPNISGTQIESIEVPLPPLSEQTQIAESTKCLQKTISEKTKYVASINCLKKALMQDLLTGKVRVKTD